MAITKNMTIGEILETNEKIADVLTNVGMHCLGCPSAQAETLEQACDVHNLNCDELLHEINETLQ